MWVTAMTFGCRLALPPRRAMDRSVCTEWPRRSTVHRPLLMCAHLYMMGRWCTLLDRTEELRSNVQELVHGRVHMQLYV